MAAFHGHGQVITLAAVTAAWDEIVGPDVAAHATPLRIREGVLVVAVDQPAWATQLQFLAGQILDRLAALAGPGLVEGLEATVRRT